MKVWFKFNAGFQLCPPDFNFALPPRSREAGDAPGILLQILLSFTLIFHLWFIVIGGNRGMLSLKILCCFVTFQISVLCVYIHNQQKLCL